MSSAQAQALEEAIRDVEDLKNGPTLFAYEKVSGKFVIGYITNNTMFVHTDGDDLLVADADGALSSLAYTNDDLKAIQGAVNEHFETSTFGITAIQSSFIAGSTVPNWDAYEKIEIPKRRVAAKIPSGSEANFIVGEIENSTFKVYAKSSGGIISNNSGLIIADNGPAAYASQYIIGIFDQYGVTINTVVDEMVDLEINTYIPNWSQFEILE